MIHVVAILAAANTAFGFFRLMRSHSSLLSFLCAQAISSFRDRWALVSEIIFQNKLEDSGQNDPYRRNTDSQALAEKCTFNGIQEELAGGPAGKWLRSVHSRN